MSHSLGGCGFALRNCIHGWTRSSRGSGAVIEKDNVDFKWSIFLFCRYANRRCDGIERVDEGEKKKPHYPASLQGPFDNLSGSLTPMMVHQIRCDWLVRLSLAEMYVLDDNSARFRLECIPW